MTAASAIDIDSDDLHRVRIDSDTGFTSESAVEIVAPR